MKSRVRPLHVLQYVALRGALTAVRCLGPDTARRLAGRLAALFFRLDHRHRERALLHLSQCFPEMDEETRRETARSSFRSFAMTLAESLFHDRTLHQGSILEQLDIRMDPAAQAVMDAGRGAVFATAHIGNWEMTGAGVALLGVRLVSVARPIENPLIDRLVVSSRERQGQRIITKRGAVREMARTLRDGGWLGILVDQSAGRRGIFVPFFGRSASTTAAPATLALRFRVPIVPAWQRRLPDGRGHRLDVEAPIAWPETGDRDEDVYRMTAELTARVEAWVREEPGQWLWAHRRWKSVPPAEASGRIRAGAEVTR